MRHSMFFIMACLLLGACTQASEGGYAAAASVSQWKNDTGTVISDLFSYNPRPRTPQPASTRYCYQFASDIVCYDNPQPQLTSRLVGVQGGEGPRIIVHQPPAQAGYVQAASVPLFPSDAAVAAPIDTSQPIIASAPQATPAPFAQASGAVNAKVIQSQNIPPPTAKP